MSQLTKPEVIEKLEELGVDYDEKASVADLRKLLVENSLEEEEEEEEEEEKSTKKGKEAVVTWGRGARVYSEEKHGKDFEKLAKQFAGKQSIQGEVKVM